MTKRKAKVLWWTINSALIGCVIVILSLITVRGPKPYYRGWAVWPITSHHIIWPALMGVAWVVVPIGVIVSWIVLGIKAGYLPND